MPPARLATVLVGTLILATRATAVAPIPWTAAGNHVRRLVTVEGVVARAATTPERRCVLEFDLDDPAALRVVVIIPFITDLPADPARLYQGKRVQVTGRVTRFRDRLEMLVTPAQIDVVGLSEAPPAPPAAAPVAPPPATTPPVRSPLPVPPAIVDPRCAEWRSQRTAVRSELRALASRLDECLAADRSGCAALGDQLGPPLSRLTDVEQRLDAFCP